MIRSIGPYTVLRELARGGMGVVVRAKAPDGTDVAIKVLIAARSATGDMLGRFKREIKALLRLDHPHVVRILDWGEHDGAPYLVMPYLRGVTLQEHLNTFGRLDPRWVAEIAFQLAQALAHAHAEATLHRDLKPANVILTGDRHAVLTDFGLAKDLDRSLSDSGLTQRGRFMGTPGYWPPEQARGELEHMGPRSDIYGLGAIMYALLTGAPPFDGESLIEFVVATTSVEPTPPSELRPDMPADLEHIVLRCLAKDPTDRYPTALALAANLNRFLNGEPVSAAPTEEEPEPEPFTFLGADPERPNLLIVGAGVGLIALLILIGVAVANLSGPGRSGGQETDVGDGEAVVDPPPNPPPVEPPPVEPPPDPKVDGPLPPPSMPFRDSPSGAPWAQVPSSTARRRLLERASTADPAARVTLERALLYAAGGNSWESSLPLFEAARDRAPACPVVAVERARFFVGREAYVRASSEISRARALGADPLHLDWLDAQNRYHAGAGHDAAPIFERVAERGPRRAEGAYAMAMLVSMHRSVEDMQPGLTVSLRAHPANADLRILLAAAQANQMPPLPQRARRSFEQALDLEGTLGCQGVRALLMARGRGLIYSAGEEGRAIGVEELGDLIEGYESAFPLTAGSGLYLDVTQVLQNLSGEHPYYDLMDEWLDEVLRRQPNLGMALFLKGGARLSARAPKEQVLEHWRRAFRAEPRLRLLPKYRERYRHVYGGDAELAEFEPGRRQERSPTLSIQDPWISPLPEATEARLRARGRRAEAPARAALVRALLAAGGRGELDLVVHFLQQAHDAAPRCPVVALERVRIYSGRDCVDRVADALQHAQELKVAPLELQRLRAEWEMRRGRLVRARSALGALAKVDPNGVEGLCAAATERVIDGDRAGAERLAKRALQRDPDHMGVRLLLAETGASADVKQRLDWVFLRQGALDVRLMLGYAVQFLQGSPGKEQFLLFMRRAEDVHSLSGGAWSRVVFSRAGLRFLSKEPALEAWILTQLKAATRLESKRAGVHVLWGALELQARGGEGRVLGHWRRALELDPDASFGPFLPRFRERFGRDAPKEFRGE